LRKIKKKNDGFNQPAFLPGLAQIAELAYAQTTPNRCARPATVGYRGEFLSHL
jgi:hypothetical protein